MVLIWSLYLTQNLHRNKMCYKKRGRVLTKCHNVYSCGGGVQVRRRQFSIKRQCEDIAAFACRKSKYQERPCNEACPNGIALGNGRCWCRDGWQGRCCDQGTCAAIHFVSHCPLRNVTSVLKIQFSNSFCELVSWGQVVLYGEITCVFVIVLVNTLSIFWE